MAITLEDAHFEEHFAALVEVALPGYRTARIFIPLSLLFGAGCLAMGVVTGDNRQVLAGLFLGLAALLGAYRLRRRRMDWLLRCRSHPHYGRTVGFLLRDGTVVQEVELGSEPPPARLADLRVASQGYVLRFTREPPGEVPAGLSTTHASVYIPHRALTPPMTREAFLGLLLQPSCERR